MDDNGSPKTELTKTAILEANDFQLEPVGCPEWGGVLYIGTISADDRDTYESEFAKQQDGDEPNLRGVRAALVARCAMNSQGEPLGFTPSEIFALGQKSAKPIDRCFEVAQRLNGMGRYDVTETKKNSHPADAQDSGSN